MPLQPLDRFRVLQRISALLEDRSMREAYAGDVTAEIDPESGELVTRERVGDRRTVGDEAEEMMRKAKERRQGEGETA